VPIHFLPEMTATLPLVSAYVALPQYLGLSLDFVAAHMRWQASYLQALEQGEYTPDTQEIASLAHLYCCDPSWLTGMSDDNQAETLPDDIGIMLNHADMSELDRAEVLRFYHFLTHALEHEV